MDMGKMAASRCTGPDTLPKSQQIMIRVEQGKLPLSPGFCGQRGIGVNGHLIVQQEPVQLVNTVGSDVDLPVVVVWVKRLKFKEMNLDMVFPDDQIVTVVGDFFKTQLAEIKIFGERFIAHGQFGVNCGQHIFVELKEVFNAL